MTKVLRYVAGTPGQLDAGASATKEEEVSVSAVAVTAVKEAVEVSVSTVAAMAAKETVDVAVAATAAKEAVDVLVSTVAATAAKAEAVDVSVSTVAATAVATGHLALKVEGYSWLKAMHGENGSYIESSEVEVGGHTWTIRCYLNGSKKKDAGYMSLFLHLCSDSSAVRAEYELAMVRPQGQCALIRPSHGLRTFGGKGYAWGSPRFIEVKGLELEQNGFLKDDCFTVRGTVTVVEERTAKEVVGVQADDMARLMGMLCKCDDDLCKREHARPPAETFLERFANFCYSICRGSISLE